MYSGNRDVVSGDVHTLILKAVQYNQPDQTWKLEMFAVHGYSPIGIVTAIPAYRSSLQNELSAVDAALIQDSVGICSRSISQDKSAADLGITASEALIKDLDWSADSIDALVTVTQTPDAQVPGNSFLIHRALGLRRDVLCLDINLACSGFIHALSVVYSMLTSMEGSRGVIVVGDQTSRITTESDPKLKALFGDAIAAIAVEKAPSAKAFFHTGADGSGYSYLCSRESLSSSSPSLVMDGTQVFAFTIREVVRSVELLLGQAGIEMAHFDHVVFHQANRMMLQHLYDRLDVPVNSRVLRLQDIGNTGAASIPAALTGSLAVSLSGKTKRVLLSGFGAGWSWATMAAEWPPLKVCREFDV